MFARTSARIGVRWRSEYILGVGHRDGQFVVIFNLSKLLSSEDVALLRTTARTTELGLPEARSCA